MTIDQYEKMAIKEVELFCKYWKKNSVKSPDQFPPELEPGNWNNKLIFFLQIHPDVNPDF